MSDQNFPPQLPSPQAHGQWAPVPSQAYPHHYAPPVGPATDQKVGNTAEVVASWIFTVLTLGYMLPWAIAATRGKSNSAAIALVDFFTGWTFVGWIAALVMACGSHQQKAANMHVVVAQQFGGPNPQWPNQQYVGQAPQPQWGWDQQQAAPQYPQGEYPQS